MTKKIKVIIKNPGCKPYGTAIDPSEESIRKKLGGEYKRLRIFEDGCVLCRKDQAGLEYNCEWFSQDFYGPMIWAGYSETELLPFPDDFQMFKKLNYHLFEAFEKKPKHSRGITDTLLLGLLIGGWGFIGYELVRHICELL